MKTALCRFAVEDYSMAHSDLREALKLSREETVTLSDHRQLAEILNNLGCLSYLGGEIESAMLYFNEAVHIQNIVSEHSMYIGSKFACHSAQLNTSITKANIGFLSLVMSDISGSVSMFESALKVCLLLLWIRLLFLTMYDDGAHLCFFITTCKGPTIFASGRTYDFNINNGTFSGCQHPRGAQGPSSPGMLQVSPKCHCIVFRVTNTCRNCSCFGEFLTCKATRLDQKTYGVRLREPKYPCLKVRKARHRMN